MGRHHATTTAPPSLRYVTASADQSTGRHRAFSARSRALARTVVGGAGLMLATVATTAAAKPLAPEPQEPVASPLQDTVDATLSNLNLTPSAPIPLPPPPPPAPAPAAQPVVRPPRPTDQLSVWIDEAIAILEAHGCPASRLSASDIRLIIVHESGGNPYAINNWDSNAADGTPSKGLMQIIAPTFGEWALPGYDNIWNPVDNIVAAARYIVGAYGSVQNAPGIISLSLGEGYRGY